MCCPQWSKPKCCTHRSCLSSQPCCWHYSTLCAGRMGTALISKQPLAMGGNAVELNIGKSIQVRVFVTLNALGMGGGV